MIKQVKLLTLLGLVATSNVILATNPTFLEPASKINVYGCVKSIPEKYKTLGLLAGAVALGNIANAIDEREFDEKRCCNKSTGAPEVDPMVADIVYSLAQGTGY